MGLFSRKSSKSNRSQLDKSLIRAFSAVLYFDSTMGGFFKMGGSGDNAERVQAALGALAKAIADNGSVSGNETIGSLTDSKIKALHGAGLLVKDCHVFPVACIMWAREDADTYGANQSVKQDLETALGLFLSAAVMFEDADDIARSAAQNQARYRQFASIMDNA